MKKINSKIQSAIIVILSFLLLIMLNAGVNQFSDKLGLRIDMTADKLYELSDATEEVLDKLDMDVKIKVFASEDDFTPLVAEVLRRYEQASDKLTVEYVDPFTRPTVVDEYIAKGLAINLNTVVIEGENYADAIELEDMFVLDDSRQNVKQLNCEQLITSAVLRAEGARDRKAAFIAGHNEYVSDSLRALFVSNNYTISDISLNLKDIEKNTDIMIIAAPTSDFSSAEIAKLDEYMTAGGRILVFAEPSVSKLANLSDFLNEWGIGLTDVVVAEKTQYTDSNPLSIVPIYSGHEINSYFNSNKLYLELPSTSALNQEFVTRGNITTAKLLYSSDRSYNAAAIDNAVSSAAAVDKGNNGDNISSNVNNENAVDTDHAANISDNAVKEGIGGDDAIDRSDETGPFTLAMAAEKTIEKDSARLVVIGSRGIYSDSLMNSGTNGNARFIAQCVTWCTRDDALVSVAPKNISDEPIYVTFNQIIIFAVLLIFVLPAGLMIQGIMVYMRRRHS